MSCLRGEWKGPCPVCPVLCLVAHQSFAVPIMFVQSAKFTFESLLSISFSIFASYAMMQLMSVDCCVDFSLTLPMVMWHDK